MAIEVPLQNNVHQPRLWRLAFISIILLIVVASTLWMIPRNWILNLLTTSPNHPSITQLGIIAQEEVREKRAQWDDFLDYIPPIFSLVVTGLFICYRHGLWWYE